MLYAFLVRGPPKEMPKPTRHNSWITCGVLFKTGGDLAVTT